MRGLQNAILIFILCIPFIRSPSLALVLNFPTLSAGPLRDEIDVTWTASSEDPRIFDIKLHCDSDMERIAVVRDVHLWTLEINISVPDFFDEWILTGGPCHVRVVDSGSGDFVDQLDFDRVLGPAEFFTSSTTSSPKISTSASPTHSSSSISTTPHNSSRTEKTDFEHSPPATTPTSRLKAPKSTHLTTGEGTPSSQVTTSVTSRIDSPETTASDLPSSAINGNRRGAIIGGTIGGVAFLCALVGLVMVYRWCRAGRVARSKIHFEGGSNSVTNGIPNGDRVEDHVEDSEAIVYAPSVADSRWDSSQSISPLTSGGGVPRATSDERPQSEFRDPGEQNDHERVGFSAKEQHEDRGPVDYSDSSEMEEEMFRAGVEQMGRRIAEIELRLQMVQLDIDSAPPGYSSDGPLIGAQSHMRPS